MFTRFEQLLLVLQLYELQQVVFDSVQFFDINLGLWLI